ncbi:MAG: hypothetical protein IKU65_05850 [Oscillospiraceae bacterium]|nr:hypothetical protein [Oscillospiraceae bacterium]
MFNIKIADVSIGIENKYNYIQHMCRDYLTNDPALFSVSASDEEILRENIGEEDYPAAYLETLALYRKIAERLYEYNGFLMHGVLLSTEGKGILLCAESGTGKTTHARLWLCLPGRTCEIINGDKPLIRIIDGKPVAYGTPWCGKEGINKNSSVVLTDVCFIERAKENRTLPLPKEEVLQKLLPAIHIPGKGAGEVLEAIDVFAKNVKFWRIECNMDISAAETAYKEIMNE